LSDFLRAVARATILVPDPDPRAIPGLLVEKPDPKAVLANAVSLWLGSASTALPWEGSTVTFQEKIPPAAAGQKNAPGDRRKK
jgi:hypothetical protein